MTTTVNGTDIVTVRVLQAPRERVWRAWTDPAELARWWGPKGFTNTFQAFDPRPEGRWRFVMHGPDGRDYKNESVFLEVTEPERIVFDHVVGHPFRATASFAAANGGTEVTYRMTFPSVAACGKVRGFVPRANEEVFDRLAAVLAGTPQEGEET